MTEKPHHPAAVTGVPPILDKKIICGQFIEVLKQKLAAENQKFIAAGAGSGTWVGANRDYFIKAHLDFTLLLERALNLLQKWETPPTLPVTHMAEAQSGTVFVIKDDPDEDMKAYYAKGYSRLTPPGYYYELYFDAAALGDNKLGETLYGLQTEIDGHSVGLITYLPAGDITVGAPVYCEYHRDTVSRSGSLALIY